MLLYYLLKQSTKFTRVRVTTEGKRRGDKFLRQCAYVFGVLFFAGLIFSPFTGETEVSSNFAESQSEVRQND